MRNWGSFENIKPSFSSSFGSKFRVNQSVSQPAKTARQRLTTIKPYNFYISRQSMKNNVMIKSRESREIPGKFFNFPATPYCYFESTNLMNRGAPKVIEKQIPQRNRLPQIPIILNGTYIIKHKTTIC
jgi:hypothetical protein